MEPINVLERPEPSALPETPDGSDAPERQMLGDLEDRLIARFSPAVRPEDVRRCVAQIAVGYDDARVRTYLAILIERGASERLQALVRQGLCNRHPVGQRGSS
jgi:hypothetical protein